MPRPVSSRHAPMTLYSRAAQFAPFAALTGLDEEMEEAGRLTESDICLTPERIAELDRALRLALEQGRTVTVTCFVPDSKKEGGSFKSYTGRIKKADPVEGLLILEKDTVIPFWTVKQIV